MHVCIQLLARINGANLKSLRVIRLIRTTRLVRGLRSSAATVRNREMFIHSYMYRCICLCTDCNCDPAVVESREHEQIRKAKHAQKERHNSEEEEKDAT